MKHIIILLILLVTTGCSEDFLTQYPETSLNEGSFYTSEDDFVGLANGLYTPMRDYNKSAFWVLAEVASDNTSFMFNASENASAANLQRADFFLNTAATESTFDSFWTLSYNGVTRCNKLLAEISRPVAWSKDAIKERTIGEAKFMRALYYFNLVRLFGGVPLVIQPIDYKEAMDIPRSGTTEVYNFIVKDLTEAVVHLDQAEAVKQMGRANRGAAQSLLAKVHLTLKNYPAAEPLLKQVIDSGEFELLRNYADVFDPKNKNHKESIFAVQFSENNANMAHDLIFRFVPHTSKGEITQRPAIAINNSAHGWNMPTKDLLNAFEAGDLRKAASIGNWTGPDYDGEVRSIAYCNKYKAPVSAPDRRTGDNVLVIRYSDVLLMYAEVLNELNRTTDAAGFVEKVRNRAGLIQPISAQSKSAMQELIAKERQVEFCFENQRWFDLLRTGKALEVMTAHGIREKAQKAFIPASAFVMTAEKLLFPIPNIQVAISGLSQNPGY
jgi:hypothetical protein